MAEQGTDPLVTDRAGVARIFACSLNHVNKMRAKGMPRMSHGTYSIPAVVQWKLEDVTNRGALDADELPQIIEARTALLMAQEVHKRIEIRRLEGELLDAEDVRANMMELCQLLVTTLEGLPSRAAQDLAGAATPAEAVAKLREHCHDVRIELEQRLAALAGAVAPAEPAGETATAAQRGTVGGRGADRATGEPAAGALAD